MRKRQTNKRTQLIKPERSTRLRSALAFVATFTAGEIITAMVDEPAHALARLLWQLLRGLL